MLGAREPRVLARVVAMADLIRERLLKSLDISQPRFLRIIAPAGYGKSTLARQYSESFQRLGTCDCLGSGSAFELVKRLAYALSSTAPDANALVMEALAFGEDVSAWAAFCRRVWHSPNAPSLLVIENGEALQDDVGARGVVMELLSSPNPDHRLALCSRVPFSLRSGRFAAPNEIVTIGPKELRFDRSEIAAVLNTGVDDRLVARVDTLTEGWPMAVFLVARLLEEGKLFVLDEADRAADLDALYDYLAEQILESLDVRQTELLTALAVVPNPTIADLERLHPNIGRRALLADIARMAPFVAQERAGTYAVHPLMRAMIRERYMERKDSILLSIAQGAADAGDVVRAAQLFFEAGDQHAAARMINFGGMFIATPPPPVADLMTQIDADVMIHYPALWNAATITRAYAIPPRQWMSEGEFVWRSLTGKEDLVVRTGVMFSLANVYANDGRFADTLRLCDEFEASLSESERELGHAAAEFFRGTVLLYRAKPIDFDRYRACIAPFLEHPVTRALADYDFVARLHRLNGERSEERAALERALHTALASKLPLVVSLIAMDAAFGAWLAAEDDLVDRYLALVEEHSPASVINGCRLFIDAVRGRIENLAPGYEKIKTRAYAYVIAASKAADREKARALAQQAVAAADHSAQPFAQVLARMCLATIDTTTRASAFREARTIAQDVSSERFRTDLDRVIAGKPNGTMWEKLIGRLRTRQPAEAAGSFTLRLADGRLESLAGDVIPLTNRELELVAFLTIGKRPHTTEEIADAIWPDNPDTGISSLKVVVARVRQKSGDPTIIELTPDGYAVRAVTTASLAELDELLRLLRRDAAQAYWPVNDIEALIDWLRRLRDGFPVSVSRWPWFGPIEARYLHLLHDAALLTARSALDAQRFDVAVRIAHELAESDQSDDVALEIAARARAALVKTP